MCQHWTSKHSSGCALIILQDYPEVGVRSIHCPLDVANGFLLAHVYARHAGNLRACGGGPRAGPHFKLQSAQRARPSHLRPVAEATGRGGGGCGLRVCLGGAVAVSPPWVYLRGPWGMSGRCSAVAGWELDNSRARGGRIGTAQPRCLVDKDNPHPSVPGR